MVRHIKYGAVSSPASYSNRKFVQYSPGIVLIKVKNKFKTAFWKLDAR